MAGKGSRFTELANKKPEYLVPKPLIDVKGKPMIAWSLASYPDIKPSDFIFIILEEHQKKYDIVSVLKGLLHYKAVNVVLISKVTRGAIETALFAEKYIQNHEEIIITDSDLYFDSKPLLKTIREKASDIAGVTGVDVPPDTLPKYSFTLVDKHNIAVAVGEKDPELAKKGAYANMGAYHFFKWSIFANEARQMIRENALAGPEGKKEFYIAPLYQRLINKKKRITVALIKQIYRLGTPDDLEKFLKKRVTFPDSIH
jgi:NDP-sugar pyrophosphorylase family protein